jgi:predicted phosphoadenosine phosphosulfate sulfurtransferase
MACDTQRNKGFLKNKQIQNTRSFPRKKRITDGTMQNDFCCCTGSLGKVKLEYLYIVSLLLVASEKK